MSGPWENYAPQEGPWTKYGVPQEPQRPAGEQAARIVGQTAQGANRSIYGTIAAPFDLAASATNALGLSSGPSAIGEAIRKAPDYLATLPGRIHDFTDILHPKKAPFSDGRTSEFAPENRAEKIAGGVGEGVGAVLSTMLPAAAVANTAKAGGLTQAVAKTLASQPVTQLASGAVGGGVTGATDDPLLGLAAGLAVPLGVSAARGIVSPTTNKLSDAERRLIDVAKREGVPLTPSQQTGSGTLRALEETMAKLPLSNGPMRGTYEGQRTALNRAIMARAGATADDASPATLTKVSRDLGQQFDDLAARTTLNADKTFADDVLKVATNYGRRLETDVAPVFKSYMDDLQPVVDAIAKGQNPSIAGETYKAIRSDLSRRMRSTTNGELKEALGGLQKALDGVVDRSASGPLLKEWQGLRKEYAAFKTVDKAMQSGTQLDRSAGNIPLGSFTNAVRSGDRSGYARARGQYGELAKLADYLAPKIPDSGTATRAFTANALTGGALFGGAAATGAGLPAAVAAAGAPWAASKIYNTPAVQKYLTNQVAGNTDLGALYGAEALRRLIEGGQGKGEPTALARALMQASEKRAGAAR